jgi:hypothetical protein
MLLLAGFAFEGDLSRARRTVIRALNRWVDQGLGVQTGPGGDRRFDPVEVVIFLKKAGLEHGDSFWPDRYIETGRRLVGGLPGAPSQLFNVEFRRSFFLRDTPVGKAMRVRAPLPLSSAHGHILELATFIEGAPHARLLVADGRLEARFAAEGQSEVTLGAACRIGGADHGVPAGGIHAPQDYLKPVEGLIAVSPAVRQLAQRLVGDRPSGQGAIRAFWNYMMDELACGPIHYDQVDPIGPCDWVLRSGWYDCQLGSALFAALCRSQGIPARLLSGHVLYAQAPTNHYWAEVWVEERGWTPFDFLSWDLSRGGRDPLWREHFFGRIDHRMVMQRLPYEFTGALGVAVPTAWHILQRRQGRGVCVSLDDLDRRPVYRDAITVSPA